MKELFDSEILQNKNDKCPFSYICIIYNILYNIYIYIYKYKHIIYYIYYIYVCMYI